jgi:hypothetical protein
MHTFLEEVVDKALDTYSKPEDLIFVLPSKRAGNFLKHILAARVQKTIFSPLVFSIEDFIAHISGIKYAPNPYLLFELYSAYLQTGPKEAESFYDFSKWGQTVLQDFNEIDSYLVASEKLFSYLADIKEIDHWSVEPGNSRLIEGYLQFWNTLQPLYTQFRSNLLAKKQGYQGLLYREACSRLEDYLEGVKGKHHIFLGFNALNKAESTIIQTILGLGRAKIFWDADPYYLDDPTHDAGYFIRKHKKTWPYLAAGPLEGISNKFDASKHIHITAVPKNVSQVKFIGGLLEEINTQSGDPLGKTAVVLGDESLLNPLLNSIPESIGSVNITMGYPLRHCAVAGFFTRIFELYLHQSPRGWYYRKIISLLTHPLSEKLLMDKEESVAGKITGAIKLNNWIYLDTPKILSVQGTPERLIRKLFLDEIPSPNAFISYSIELILSLQPQVGDSRESMLLEQLYRFYALFNQLQEYTSQFSFVPDLKTLYSLFQALLSSETIDFRGEPMEGLQIMGMLESRNLDFETVILSSVNEGILPSGKSNASYIPFDLKKQFGLPTYKDKDAIYTYHFYRLLQRAKRVYLIYNSEPDTLEGGERSRLVTQLMTDKHLKATIEHHVAAPELKAPALQAHCIPKDALLMQKIKAVAARGFSPTSLVNYIRNPIEFYKKTILDIDETTEVDESITASVFGTVMHGSLEELYLPLLGKDLTVKDLNLLLPKIKKVVHSHFRRIYSESDIRKGKNYIAFNVLVRYLERFIEIEVQGLEKNKVRLLGLERKYRVPLEVAGIDFPIYLKGFVDRIEEFNGRERIIDYKTGNVVQGNVEISDWGTLLENADKSKAFQLLSYAYIHAVETGAEQLEAGIISLKNLNAGTLLFAMKEEGSRSKKETRINSNMLTGFKGVLDDLLLEICDPAIPFMEKLK